MQRKPIGFVEAGLFLAGIAAVSSLTVDPKRDRRFYQRLDTPSWAPPGWAFGAVWPVLNIIQVYGDVTLLNTPPSATRSRLLALRAANWSLFALFTPAFFRARSPVLGTVVAYAEALVTYATVVMAWKRARPTALANLPLAAWLTFASALSTDVAVRNPDPVARRIMR